MRKTVFTAIALSISLSVLNPATADTLNLKGFQLTFDDEFNGLSVSQNGRGTTWADIRAPDRFDAYSDIGFGRSSFLDAGSGYNPFRISGGGLTISGIPYTVPFGYPGSWQSGLIHSEGSFVQSYGYFEMRAKFNSVQGTWPAFWLLPVTVLHPAGTNPSLWQELDIVEQYGAYPQGVYSTIHTTEPAPQGVTWNFFSSHPEIANGYHTYGMDWEASNIKFYVDGVLMGTKPTPTDMTGPMYILVDLARDAGYPGSAPAMSMNIDYIRAFSNDSHAVAVQQDKVSAPDGNDPGLHGATAATVLPSDRLSIDLYEQAYQGDCQMLVSLDGVALGGVQTVTGSSAKPETFTVPANIKGGSHTVSVLLVNPLDAGVGSMRILYIKDIKVNGAILSGSAQQTTGVASTYSIKVPTRSAYFDLR